MSSRLTGRLAHLSPVVRLLAKPNYMFTVKLIKENQTDADYWVHAISNKPGSMLKQFSQTERTMRILGIQNLILLPRDSPTVVKVLNDLQIAPPVNFRLTNLSAHSQEIQSSILSLMHSEIYKLKHSHPDILEFQELLSHGKSSFYREIDKYTSPHSIFYRLLPQEKRIVSDLAIFRRLLGDLVDNDAPTFYLNLLASTKQNDGVSRRLSPSNLISRSTPPGSSIVKQTHSFQPHDRGSPQSFP